jgi:hypothetical protein
MLYDPKLDERLENLNHSDGMIGVIMQKRKRATVIQNSVKKYEDDLSSLKQSKFYKHMEDLKASIIQ